MAKRRLTELKKQLEKKNKEELKVRHLTDIQQIETSHLSEFNEFNDFWDKKMQDFENEAKRIYQQTVDKHNEELQQFAEELERQIPLKPKVEHLDPPVPLLSSDRLPYVETQRVVALLYPLILSAPDKGLEQSGLIANSFLLR